jgi:hypothetical protein
MGGDGSIGDWLAGWRVPGLHVPVCCLLAKQVRVCVSHISHKKRARYGAPSGSWQGEIPKSHNALNDKGRAVQPRGYG